MPMQNILISLRCAPLHQDILHRGLDKRQYSIYTEKGKRATDQPLSPQSHFSAVDCFYRVFFAEPQGIGERLKTPLKCSIIYGLTYLQEFKTHLKFNLFVGRLNELSHGFRVHAAFQKTMR